MARLTLLLLVLVGAGQVVAASPECAIPKTLVNDQGWEIPGVKDLGLARVEHESTIQVEGRPVLETSYDPYWDEKLHHPGTVMPHVCIAGDVAKFWEREYVPLRIQRFSYSGRVFCYLISVATYDYNDKTGIGGVVGDGYAFAFYDEDGDGRFETQEWANTMMGSPDMFRVKLPQWVLNLPVKPNVRRGDKNHG